MPTLKQTIIDIAKYHKITHLNCKQCGLKQPVEDVRYETNDTRKYLVIAHCSLCGSVIRNMPKDKLFRVFDFVDKRMLEISKSPTNLLRHYLLISKDDRMVNEIKTEITKRYYKTVIQHQKNLLRTYENKSHDKSIKNR